uniref:Uncharacterized protein n=1 Tax=Alexandrium catenella TaxID=2925 RepID=A0A7S1RTV7_ALECA
MDSPEDTSIRPFELDGAELQTASARRDSFARAVGHWHQARTVVQACGAMDSILTTVRGRQTEELYEQEWSTDAIQAAASAQGPLPAYSPSRRGPGPDLASSTFSPVLRLEEVLG